MVAIRVFASLCALGIVVAFAIAALLPPAMDLGEILLSMNPKSVGAVHQFLLHHRLRGIWDGLLLPFLLRPGWMPPLMAGVIAGGIAFSLTYLGPTRQSTRRSG